VSDFWDPPHRKAGNSISNCLSQGPSCVSVAVFDSDFHSAAGVSCKVVGRNVNGFVRISRCSPDFGLCLTHGSFLVWPGLVSFIY